MNKDKLKVSFEIDRYKVIGMLSRNCGGCNLNCVKACS